VLLLAVAIVGALPGCAANETPLRTTDSEPESSVPSEAADAWPAVDESGTGATTITIPNPSPDAFYLDAKFSCTTGDFWVELVEDPRVFMSGSCGGTHGYQMPLPSDSAQHTFTIELDPDASFTFTGQFQADGAAGG
jgi:hypothetical protein